MKRIGTIFHWHDKSGKITYINYSGTSTRALITVSTLDYAYPKAVAATVSAFQKVCRLVASRTAVFLLMLIDLFVVVFLVCLPSIILFFLENEN